MAGKYVVFNEDGTLNVRLIKGLHTIPKGAIQVDEELWQRLINETDGIWVLGSDGSITKEPLPIVAPDFSAIERLWRDGEIERVKWLRERHRDQRESDTPTTLNDAQFVELLGYIQELRDWPQAKKFPNQKYRPATPEWIAEQSV